MCRIAMFGLTFGLASAVAAAPPSSSGQSSPPAAANPVAGCANWSNPIPRSPAGAASGTVVIGCLPGQESAVQRDGPDGRQAAEPDEEELGDAYWQGSADTPRSPSEAVTHYKAAATRGSASAARKVAIAYANGEGVAPDDTQMLRWTRIAAHAGDAEAAGMLGYEILIGIDGTYDLVEAAAWLTLASEKAQSTGWRARAAAIAREAESKLTRPEQEALNARLARWRDAPNAE